jgi:hypothetical protein
VLVRLLVSPTRFFGNVNSLIEDPSQPSNQRTAPMALASNAVFPFLKLPAELRDYIYEYAIPEHESSRIIYYTVQCFERLNPNSTSSLMGVCQQVRFEYRSVYMAQRKISIDFSTIHQFGDIPLPRFLTAVQNRIPLDILVEISWKYKRRYTSLCKTGFNMTPLFFALTQGWQPRFSFEKVPREPDWSVETSKLLDKEIDKTVEIFKMANSMPRGILKDIESGYLLKVKFQMEENFRKIWKYETSKEDFCDHWKLGISERALSEKGGWSETELKRIEAYIMAFYENVTGNGKLYITVYLGEESEGSTSVCSWSTIVEPRQII